MATIPRFIVPPAPMQWDGQADPATWSWEDVPALPPFRLADGSCPAEQQTVARLCYDSDGLYIRFDCEDRDIWGTYTQRDDPLYDEEVVEVFLAPGQADPVRYFEFEVSPDGVLFDARIYNPTAQRAELEVDQAWNCPGIRWRAGRDDASERWWAVLVIPWAAMTPAGDLPRLWRANLYRIERPHDDAPEYSCWSPTMTEPADFHKPAYFGILELG